MPEPFRGTVNVDIRDSQPDRAPFVPPKAPPGAPNVVYIVLDDVGFSAMNCYAGQTRRPTSSASRGRACVMRNGTRPLYTHRPGPAC
jgi:hypothetical protein